MLKRVDESKTLSPVLQGAMAADWETAAPVWVHSKSQAPYLFNACNSLCSPAEWPYNLEVLRGTEDYDDIIDWFVGRKPVLSREAWERFDAHLAEFFKGRQISIRASEDPEFENPKLVFRVWGFTHEEVLEGADNDRFYESVWAIPHLDAMWPCYLVYSRSGPFEDRHLIK